MLWFPNNFFFYYKMIAKNFLFDFYISMQINYDNINFQSKIKFISEPQFNKVLIKLPCLSTKFVSYPWTIETLKKGYKNIFTREICNCIAGFITNGKDNLMFHLMTRNKKQAKKDKVKPFNINNIEEKLKQSINFKDQNIHAIILGGLKSVDKDLDNNDCFNQIVKFFSKYQIPCSIIGPKKDLPISGFGEYSILYTQDNDTLYITDSRTESPFRGKKEIEVKNDCIIYNLYKTIDENLNLNDRLSSDIIPRVKTGTEDFLKSRFENVKLCSFDEFV